MNRSESPKTWSEVTEPTEKLVSQLSEELKVDPLISRLLINRKIHSFDQSHAFFRPQLEQLHDPFLMKDMEVAIERLTKVLFEKEKILVYGDYDVDGTTAVSVVYSFFTGMGVEAEYYIPDRYNEGYGFSEAGARYAAEVGCKLIITLDCGIKDSANIAFANSLGLDVIVCDHHNVESIPPALAVLNPKRPDCTYPYKGLSGCGVGFKLIQAFVQYHTMDEAILWEYLDLVAISIGADIVPILGENRILTYFGLKRLNECKRPGIFAMLDHAGMQQKELNIEDVVFVLAPRINAAGRIFSGKQAVEILISPTAEIASELSPLLEENNKTRRLLDKEITVEALEQLQGISSHPDSYTTVVHSEKWHKGVVGIVASRLVETYYKPAIVLVETEGILSGSARSIPGVDLFDALSACGNVLLKYGGHAMAAGLSLESGNLPAFEEKFEKVVADMLAHQRPSPVLEYEAEVDFTQMSPKFYRILRQFAPFGPENMRPVFLARKVKDAGYSRKVGQNADHLKLHIIQEQTGLVFDGIGFGLGVWESGLKSGVLHDILFCLDENEWQGNVRMQLIVKDIRVSQLD
jgi:single-stranded-DNA-specific exonuclease